MDEEGVRKTDNRKIFVGSPLKLNKDTFFDHLKTLKEIAYSNNSENLVQALIDLVPTFHHAEDMPGRGHMAFGTVSGFAPLCEEQKGGGPRWCTVGLENARSISCARRPASCC